MAICEKRPFLCGVLVLGILALFFHLVGFVTPGWIILRRSVMEEEEFRFGGQLIDNGGVVPPHTDDTANDVIFRSRRSEDDSNESNNEDNRQHHGGHQHNSNHNSGDQDRSHHTPTHTPQEMSASGDDMMQEGSMVQAWMMEITDEISVYDVRSCYGLWYSKICVHDKTTGDYASAEMRNGQESSSGPDHHRMGSDNHQMGSDDNHQMGTYDCKKVSTKLALLYSSMYDEFTTRSDVRHNLQLSSKNFGYASLKENQVEVCFVLAFLVLGLISAVVGFRKVNEGKCAAIACITFMLLAACIAIVPVARLGHYSMSKAHQRGSVMVHPPYSVIATGVGALFALITAIVAGYALRMKSRNQLPGKWYQFNNEVALSSEKNEKPGLVYYTDPLPVKAGLYDVCDFDGIKPVEEVKKPEAEEKPDDFVL